MNRAAAPDLPSWRLFRCQCTARYGRCTIRSKARLLHVPVQSTCRLFQTALVGDCTLWLVPQDSTRELPHDSHAGCIASSSDLNPAEFTRCKPHSCALSQKHAVLVHGQGSDAIPLLIHKFFLSEYLQTSFSLTQKIPKLSTAPGVRFCQQIVSYSKIPNERIPLNVQPDTTNGQVEWFLLLLRKSYSHSPTACCTIRSLTLGIPRFRTPPSGFGISFLLTGSGLYFP